ncbi:LysR family transcriptional regulator [Variovorax sp. J22G21]|uniref:LysR family transcriptional regulator n=1 Tax=Variovorax fucosicus TaxID=3053517 RepID=UPI002574E0B9|nr:MULTISPECIES: LysR family transcriptional regulator [unclassified Variovorax]MDM0037724.1 LysR family transcriptional regulator [Variovorax sp. J22R193]MDM0062500.1 LysR family transcriptional regulator [Variovorax sp. J22G21]
MKNTINPARVDFVTLRLFCAVVQSGSITKGAAQCHLALSAASRRLSDFESATGTQLLERSVQGVTVTPAGHAAAQHAMRLFQGFELFSTELADYSEGYRGHVRLWANMSALTEFLPTVLSDFMALQPGIRVDIEEQLSGDIVRALLDGLADLGVFAEGTPAEGLTLAPFRKDELVLLCVRNHPLGKFRKIAFADSLDHDFVGLNRGSSLLELTSRAAANAGRPLRLRVQVRSFDAMCQMIAARLGVGVLPLAACKERLGPRGLKAVRLTDDWAHRHLMLGYSAARPLSAAARLMVEHLQLPAGGAKESGYSA